MVIRSVASEGADSVRSATAAELALELNRATEHSEQLEVGAGWPVSGQ